MKKPFALISIFLLAGLFAASVLADAPSVYKWTDTQGVVHYSDKPPKEAAPDLQTLDLPAFPAQDTAKIAADQAALAASTAALQQQMLTQAALDQQAAQLAQQRVELQATEAALQQDTAGVDADEQPAATYPIYVHSRFVPRAYRRNLYGAHRPMMHKPVSADRPVQDRPAIAMTTRP